jgi:hypothetical protein
MRRQATERSDLQPRADAWSLRFQLRRSMMVNIVRQRTN